MVTWRSSSSGMPPAPTFGTCMSWLRWNAQAFSYWMLMPFAVLSGEHW